MKEIHLKSNAKINLCLDVAAKRPDGYHDLRMVMQTVGLHDRLALRKTGGSGIELRTNLPFLPRDGRNLVYRAVEVVAERHGIRDGLRIDLRKTVPVGAGLGGGSANAATAILAMDRLFGLGMSQEEMAALGLGLGADVPFCLLGGTALAQGVGEVLTPLPGVPALQLLIAKPAESASTAKVFQRFSLDASTVHPDVDGMAAAIRRGDRQGVVDRLGNSLEATTMGMYPSVGRLKEALLEAGAENALMSGSGTAVFGVFKSREAAVEAAARIRRTGKAKMVFTTTTRIGKRG